VGVDGGQCLQQRRLAAKQAGERLGVRGYYGGDLARRLVKRVGVQRRQRVGAQARQQPPAGVVQARQHVQLHTRVVRIQHRLHAVGKRRKRVVRL
jgi:hypothetical protein